MITDKDISVVVQGKVESNILEVIMSIKNVMPRAEIIVSTWEKEDCTLIPSDIILCLNEDPGIIRDVPMSLINLNRQIISSLNGIQIASREYVIKMRTDMKLTSLSFLSYFKKFQGKNDDTFFQSKVIVSDMYTRDPLKNDALFHIGDFFFCGKKDDVLKIFDIPLAQYVDLVSGVNKQSVRYTAEQYIWLKCIQKNYNIDIRYVNDFSLKLLKKHESLFASNLILVESQKNGIMSLKYSDETKLIDCLKEKDYLILYNSKINHITSLSLFRVWKIIKRVFKDMKYRINFK